MRVSAGSIAVYGLLLLKRSLASNRQLCDSLRRYYDNLCQYLCVTISPKILTPDSVFGENLCVNLLTSSRDVYMATGMDQLKISTKSRDI